MRIAVLNNLRAGRSQPGVARVLDFLSAYPDVLHVETEGASAVPEALASLARQRVDLLVVNGGDGTLQHALTEILTSRPFEQVPMIAPLRGGRTNMTALDLGAQRDPVKGLRELIEAARADRLAERIVDRPVLRVASKTRGEEHYGMFFGAGMIYRAVSLVHRIFPSGRAQGTFGAGLVTLSLVLKAMVFKTDGILTPDKLQISVDGELARPDEFYLVIASSLEHLFLRMNPFWGTGPGGVRFTTFTNGAKHRMTAFPGILRGRPGPRVKPEAGYTSRNARRVAMRCDCGFSIDGELFDPVADELLTITEDRRVTFLRA